MPFAFLGVEVRDFVMVVRREITSQFPIVSVTIYFFAGMRLVVESLQVLVNVFDVFAFHLCAFLGFFVAVHGSDSVHRAIDSMRIVGIFLFELVF